MISTTEHLTDLCRRFLDGSLDDVEFSTKFENYLEDHADQMPEDQYRIFEPVMDAIAFYQPDPAIRAGEDMLLDKDQLCSVVRKVLSAVQN